MLGWRLVAAVAGALLLSAVSVPALGGLVVNGVGYGTAIANDGSYVCEDVPFEVQAVYVPGNRGVLEFNWAGIDCMHSGGATALGVVYYDLAKIPPASFQWGCTGNEQTGLDCTIVRIGPYGGPGSQMWLSKSATIERFFGFFTAV